MKVMTEEDYLASKGYGMSALGDAGLHKAHSRMSSKQWKPIVLRQKEKDKEWQRKRDELRQEYRNKVANGEIRPPGHIEKLIETARGHDDNPSVQAARRILKKRGLSW